MNKLNAELLIRPSERYYKCQTDHLYDELVRVELILKKKQASNSEAEEYEYIINSLNLLINERIENSKNEVTFNSLKIKDEFDLTNFEYQCLFFLLAPELDSRFSEIYSELLDNTDIRYPSIGLMLEVLCSSPEERFVCMKSFSSEGLKKLINIFPFDGVENAPLITMGAKLKMRTLNFLLGISDTLTDENENSPKLNKDYGGMLNVIKPQFDWNDLVLPEAEKEKLQEIIRRVKNHKTVYYDWGFDAKLPRGKGVTAMFAGLPGTGKTMAAEVIANELGWKLKRVDLSQVISKYIGETEKNLSHVFDSVTASQDVLVFDEADALFGRRSEVKDSKDRYANMEIAYLLQRMENYDGVAILTTNMRENIDDAFFRRIKICVDFPFPDEKLRLEIWKKVFPKEAPLAEGLDFEWLARNIRLSGGSIKNSAIAAAFSACHEAISINMEHIINAARIECRKIKYECNF